MHTVSHAPKHPPPDRPAPDRARRAEQEPSLHILTHYNIYLYIIILMHYKYIMSHHVRPYV